MPGSSRVLFVAHPCYLDASNGAAIASRGMVEALGRNGFEVEVLTGGMLDIDREVDLTAWITERHGRVVETAGGALAVGMEGVRAEVPPQLRLTVGGVPVTIHRGATTRPHDLGAEESDEFLRLFDAIAGRMRPDVVIGYGGSALAGEVFRQARARGAATAFPVHNFLYTSPEAFADVDAVLVPSRFAADYYRDALGLDCVVLPNLVDLDRVRAERREPKYLTFVNPSVEKGMYPFARIADELGRRRPDIPILVVEGRGDERTLAGSGLDLRAHGNVHLMAHTHDPRKFWRVSKACLLPSVWWENQPLVAVEAMVNGVPVVGSDRGGIPETLGDAGIVLPLPDRITQATRTLPMAQEVSPWVAAVVRLWDDADFLDEHRRRALTEAERWAPDVLGPRYAAFFRRLRPGARRAPTIPTIRSRWVVLVPHRDGIDGECEEGLRDVERAGVRVVRRGGCSAIDVARNELASEALHDGAESLLFVDSDIGFHALDALRLLARPEPVVAGVYAKKGTRAMASTFADGVGEVIFGTGAFGLTPLRHAAAGFLRIRMTALRRLIDALPLPLCNTRWGRGLWPFFGPLVVPDGEGFHYLGEDWAFSHRLALAGITPLADTSIRLWHYGRHPFGWEDVGADPIRHPSYSYRTADAVQPRG